MHRFAPDPRRPIPWPTLGALLCAAVVLLPAAAGAAGEPAHDHRHHDPALARIEADHAAGRLDADRALELGLRRVFEPSSLPTSYRSLVGAPLHCATALVREARQRRAELPAALRERIDDWLVPRTTLARRATAYTSAQGRFAISYEIEGSNAVPADDVAPANGVPDFVERIGAFLEESWEHQFQTLGFTPPDVSTEPYPVGFQAMGAYGYTTESGAGAAGTRIVLNNGFVGFPANDDPEGDVVGAMRVTCTHELRHASQYATSGWSESGLWLEVDATWVEDLTYDFVNDYLNYLGSGSPISDPTLPLDSGGSGSYEDCVWQHWMTEAWNVGVIGQFWVRRGSGTTEEVMASYDWALGQVGASLLEDFVDFASWNLATGSRAIPGFGYEEAATFPTAPLSDVATALPASFTDPVARYSARFYRVSGFTAGESGVALVTVNRALDSPLRAKVLVETIDGGRVLESLDLVSTQDVIELATPLDRIAAVTVIVAHGGRGLGTATVTVEVTEEIRPPVPMAALDASEVGFRIETGTVRSRGINLRNVGEAGSMLEFEALAARPLGSLAATRSGDRVLARDISGSFVDIDMASFEPGSTVQRIFSVANASRDFEWLSGVEITFPPGITVLSSTDFEGGGGGVLATDGSTGEGVTVSWIDPDGSWGNVRNGAVATATLELSFDLQLFGDPLVTYRIVGDGYGSDPHEVTGVVVLDGPDTPAFDLLAPTAGGWITSGQPTEVRWQAGFAEQIRIEWSRDGGQSWEGIVDTTPNDGGFEWTPPPGESAEALLRLSQVGGQLTVQSPAPFYTLAPAPWMQVSPSGGSLAPGADTELLLGFDATSLQPGLYPAEFLVFHNGLDSPLRVGVALEVTESGTPVRPDRGRYTVYGAAPNPFNPTTSLRFELFEPAHVRVEVFDSRGRRVRRLFDRELPVGPHAVRWDSRDTEGRLVASGVYHTVTRIDDDVVVDRVVLTK